MNSSSYEKFKSKNVGVLIPTFNNEKTLKKVIDDVLVFTDRIIVVNDGSTDSTSEILKSYSNIHLVSYEKNVGKGWALQQGFKKAIEVGYDYVISIDSDGQHYADDLPNFLETLEKNPKAIIIGARNMGQSSVPGKSSFGNKFSNFWFKVETGLTMPDTQSGYRLYPVHAMANHAFVTKKFEFEIEVLVRSHWRGIDVTSVPVKVFYPEKGKRVSHFRPFKDFSRISVLNTFLVTIAFLYIKPRDFFRSLKKKSFKQIIDELLLHPNESITIKALSVGFGIFMGIVPLWGFQLLIAIPTSIYFRLNTALVVIAANISVPPMIPVIIFLSHAVGSVWMGNNAVHLTFSNAFDFATIQNSLMQYVLGAFTLAVVASVTLGLITFLLLKIFRKS